MSCKLELWQHGSKTGNRAYFFDSDDGDPMTTQMNKVNDEDTSAQVTGDCAWVIMEHPEGHGGGGFIVDPGEYVPHLHDSNHHGEGKGSTNHRFYKRGDRVNRVIRLRPPTDGFYDDIDIYFKRADTRTGQWGHFPWVTEDLLNNPNDSNQLITSTTDKGQPCPGAAKASIIGHRRYRCTYDNASQIKNLHTTIKNKPGSDPRKIMYNNIVNKYCTTATRLDDVISSNGTNNRCRDEVDNVAQAVSYCSVDDRIKSETTICAATEVGGDTTYEAMAKAYCDTAAGKSDSWCACYNVYKHSTDKSFCNSNPTATGCQKMKDGFGLLVEKTPSNQKALWDGMEPCFGGVCGTGTFKPTGYNDNCGKDVNVCIQDFTIEGLDQSSVQAACVINAGSPSGVSDGAGDEEEVDVAAVIAKDELDKAQNELAAAQAAVAAGEPGAEARLEAALQEMKDAEYTYKDATIEPPSLTDFQNNPQAYFPQSIEGLKTDQRQQIGAGVMGAVALAFMMMMLLLVAGGGGGGGAPVRRRRYR